MQTTNDNGEQVRSENHTAKQSGVIALERHQEVLSVYTAVARDAVKRCGLDIPPGSKHAALVRMLVDEIHRLRGQVAVSNTLVIGPTMEVIDDGRIPAAPTQPADSSSY